MKKILMATFCLSFVVISFAQKTTTTKGKKTATTVTATDPKEKKPTKQETMDWIGGKMKDNLGLGREFISYKDGKFSYKKEWKAFVYCTTTIDLNNVTGMNNEYSKDFYISGKELTKVVCDESYGNTTQVNMSISGPNYNDYSAPFTFTTDQALVDRLKKAFKTLLEYNSAKKADGESF